MPGGDISTSILPTPSPTLCQSLCCNTSGCVSFTVAIAPSPFMTCQPSLPCCYLKGSTTARVKSPDLNITSGVVHPASSPYTVHPPSGLRSAVPVGGVGAGSVEMRGDGAFHEWTIANQSPGGAAKYGVVDDAVMGVRVAPAGGGRGQGGTARLIRTHPPHGLPGVAGLRYRGSYPVGRLDVEDDLGGVELAVFAYYALRPFDLNRSATPALVLTLTAHNPTSAAQEVGFFVNLPWGVEADQTRAGSAFRTVANVTGASACMHLCAEADQCASWTLVGADCALSADVPLNRYQTGASSGVRGLWQPPSSSSSASPTSASATGAAPLRHVRLVDPQGPAHGDVSLWPSASSSSSLSSAFSYAVSDSLLSLFADFASRGQLNSSTTGAATAVHGAAAISATLQPGQNASLSVVFAWHFPNRDHVGLNVGNFYVNLFNDSAHAAASLLGSDGSGLLEVVDDIAALHATYMDSTLPEYGQLAYALTPSSARTGRRLR